MRRQLSNLPAVRRRMLLAGMFLSAGVLGHWGMVPLTAADSAPAVKRGDSQLHVRMLEDNRWIAWIDRPTGRTRVDVPQQQAAIVKFATEHGWRVVWYGVEAPPALSDASPTSSFPTASPSSASPSPVSPTLASPTPPVVPQADFVGVPAAATPAMPLTTTPSPAPEISWQSSPSAQSFSSATPRQAAPFPADGPAPIRSNETEPSGSDIGFPAVTDKPPEHPANVPAAENSVPTRTADAGATLLPESQLADLGQQQPIPTKAPASDAERLGRLNWTIRTDERRLQELSDELSRPDGEFAQAEAGFQEVGGKLRRLVRQHAESPLEPGTPEALKHQEEVASLEKKRELAKQRLELAIQSQRLLQEQIAALQEKLNKDRQARLQLTGLAVATPSAAPSSETAPLPATTPTVTQVVAAEPAGPPVAEPTPTAAVAATSETAAAPPGKEPAATAPAAVPASATPPPTDSKELLKARAQADAKQQAATEAEQQAHSITERISSLDRNIELETRQFTTAKQRSENAYQQQQALEADFVTLSIRGDATREELQELSLKVKAAEAGFAKARKEFRERTDRLQQLQFQRAALLAEQVAALQQAREKRAAAETAVLKVNHLQNPFALHNVLQWLLDHGVKILVILLGVLFLRFMTAVFTQRIVNLMIQRGVRGSHEERADRANTLAAVFHNAASLTTVIGGILMICEEVGIAVGPLMGGAAVFGLAVAFGAQNLIRDYFYGFMILLENQYKLNDVLQIGTISGQVERITLRMTVLRDIEGRVHFIPNGKIDTVTNMTHGWSRALFDIRVTYKEDADEMMAMFVEMAAELRKDPKFGPLITDDAEMLGVNSFDESGITIRFFIKTKPLKQWPVRRELLRRIKRRFDELKIEIPFPHRTLVHQSAEAAPPTAAEGPNWDLRRSA